MPTNNCSFQKNFDQSQSVNFLTSNSESHDSHGNKGVTLALGSVHFPMSVISTKLYFVEIGRVHQKL